MAVGTLVVGLLPMDVASAASLAKHGVAAPAVPRDKRIPFTRATPERGKAAKPFKHFDPSGRAKLPAPGGATVTLPVTTAAKGLSAKATQVRAGKTPVLLGPAASTRTPSAAVAATQRVRVTMLDQKSALTAGVHGALFTLRRTSVGGGKVALTVDDSSFRYAFGGDFASRLHLVRLPACVLTTPKLARCQVQTPVRTAPGAPLTAQVSVPGAASARAGAAAPSIVMAATSDTSGSSGDYSATSLSPAGTWATSGNTGAFTYSYPIAVPAAIGGAPPNVDLSYDSSDQDGRTEGTNNQSSWLGDGWSTTENFVERTYKPCSDDSSSGAPKNDGDQCWAGQLLTLSLNGKSTQIVYDDATKTFHPATDDGTTKIEDVTGSTTNGTDNKEYFKVTQGGVQYFFGYNRLPGWSSGKDETNSVWTTPVYHAHDGVSACPDSTDFAATSCALGYRFNLDYAVDLHGNATAWYYSPETGYYGADMKNTAVSYVRGGTLARIDYGMTSSTIYSGTAPAQVVFGTAERCIAGTPAGNTCADSQFTVADAAYWPDVPIDLNCTSGSTNCTDHGPSFWSRKRLTSITTQIQTGGVTKQIDKYTFTQSFPDGGDHAPTLWLDSIQRTGLDTLGGASGSTATPSVSFDPPLQLPNRVGTIPQMPLMYHDRIQTVTSETGAQTSVTYDRPDCSSAPASDPDDPTDAAAQKFASTNTLSCFPVYWTPDGQPAPWMDWFYKYKVTSIVTEDTHNSYQDGTEPKLETDYAYKGDPGWHYDDNEVVKAKNRTWGQFRGYPEVDVTTGDPDVFHYTNGAKVYDQKTLTKTYYFLGMDGDTLPGGKTRSVPSLTSQDGTTATVADNDALAGQAFETDTYTASGGSLNKAVVDVPTIIGPTATRSRSGMQDLTAQMVRTAKSLTREAVSYGWRKTETDTFYETKLGKPTTGAPVQVDDRGENADSSNVAKCTYTRYLSNNSPLMTLPAETITTAQDCSTAGATPSGTLISDSRTSYDNKAFGYDGDGRQNPDLPTRGDATSVQAASAASGATATSFIDQTASSYDSYGRVTKTTRTPNSTSPDGKSLAQGIFTTYTPASGELPTSTTVVTQVTPGTDCSAVTVSSKDCQLTTAAQDPARVQPTAKTDAAGRLSSLTYDALGRLTAVWLPNENKANSAPANMTYAYSLSKTAPSVVTTSTLLDNGSYKINETLQDAMLRTLQTQTTAENGTTTVSDTQYDSHGWTVATNNAYDIGGSPAAKLVSVSQVSIPDTTVTDHDAMGRADLVTEEHNGAKTWTTTTAYTGDRTTVLPPKGGVPTTTVTDARGQTEELDQYKTPPTLSGSATVGFTATGGTTSATAYTYFPDGKQHQVTGPDKAVWSFGYDLLGRKTSQTDPDAGGSSYGFDDADNMISTTDAKKHELDYTYDLLGRKLTATDKKAGFQFASWAYDTLRIGLPTSSTRYVQGVTGGYTVATTGYTSLGKPTGTKITLPDSEAPLPATYTTTYTYTTNTQTLATQSDPRTQGLNNETIIYTHDALGAPVKTSSSINTYVGDTVLTNYGEPSQVTMGASTNPAQVTYGYDDQTRRLTDRLITRTQAPGPTVDEASYTYDASGNPTSATDKQSETGNTVTDQQCYSYDTLNRLTDAWTAKDDCAANPPTTGTLSTTAGSYWQSFSYDDIGNRKQSVDHAIGSSGTTSTTDYTDGCTKDCNSTGAQPHTVTATTGGTNPTAFSYDEDGNLHTRTPASGPGQTLTWDDEGHLAQVDIAGTSPSTTKYLYDADGNQLIRRDPGQTTLFAGDTEIVVNTGVTPNTLLGAVRSYVHGGGAGMPMAVRSSLPGGGGLKYLFNDPHGTANLSMDATTQQIARQQYTPYGQQRSSANTTAWPDPTRSYLGKPQDTSTGYTDVGARKYDPALGSFLSADPVFESSSPQDLGGYTYAADNPLTNSDPTGLCHPDVCGIGVPRGNVVGGSSGIITDGPIDPDNPGAGSCHHGSCSSGSHASGTLYDSVSKSPTSPLSAQPLITVPMGSHYGTLNGYGYTYTEDIGPVSRTGSPEEVMTGFQESPQAIFPFPISGCQHFTDGGYCTLHPAPKFAHGIGTVRVATAATSFKFTVASDEYFDGPGSTIEFSLKSRKGELYLTQHAVAHDSTTLATLGTWGGYTKMTWNVMAHNLRSALGVRPSHPLGSTDWTSLNTWMDFIGGNWDQFQ
ncbi:RHS repeat domain-containing protein [Streptomyces sp. LaBMicrA B280]|uniref:RHS repeat domain-containing protein n=1 Tax=Streptomyces sp. LaBMicrA B280 TaxID=3391001 RepID=UPI003BA4DDED